MATSGRLIGISVICIVIFIIIPLIIAGLSLLIYRVSYKHKINKRLAEGMDANIKPMMSPLKFIVVMVSLVIGTIMVFWGIVMVYFGVRATKQKKDMAVYPVAFELADEGLDNSPFAGYKFGDEIKGYDRYSKEYGDLKLEFYVLNNTLSSILPNVLVAADYTGDEEDVVVRQKVDYGVSQSNWSYTGFEPDRLTVLDVGGYRGEFTYAYELYYNVYDELGIDDTDAEFFNKEWDYMDSHSPDTGCKIDFKTEDNALGGGRMAGISSPQLGIVFYYD